MTASKVEESASAGVCLDRDSNSIVVTSSLWWFAHGEQSVRMDLAMADQADR
jgi:hypothetical protein